MALQDFTTWTRSGTMTISNGAATNSSVSWTTGNQVTLYKSGTFGTSFTHEFMCKWVATTYSDQTPRFWWMDNDTGNICDSGITFFHWGGGASDSWHFANHNTGTSVTGTGAGAAGTNIYVKITRSGRVYTAYFYSDSTRTTLVNSLVFNNASTSATETFSYYKFQNRVNGDSWVYAGGTVTDLDFTPPVNATVTPAVFNVSAPLVTPDYFGASRLIQPAAFDVVPAVIAPTVIMTSKRVFPATVNATAAVVAPTFTKLDGLNVVIANPVNVTAKVLDKNETLNLRTFTENDPSNFMTVTDTTSTLTIANSNNSKSRLYKDYGVGAFADFTFKIDVNVQAMVNPFKYILPLLLGNDSNPGSGGWEGGIGFFPYANGAHGWYLACGSSPYNSANRAMGTPEYFTFTKVGNTVTLYRYSDSARTSLTFSLTATDTAGATYRYLFINRDLNWDYQGGYTGTASNVIGTGAGYFKVLIADPKIVTIANPVNGTAAVVATGKKITPCPSVVDVIPNVESPTVDIIAGDVDVQPTVMLASVTTNASTIDIVFRAVFPHA